MSGTPTPLAVARETLAAQVFMRFGGNPIDPNTIAIRDWAAAILGSLAPAVSPAEIDAVVAIALPRIRDVWNAVAGTFLLARAGADTVGPFVPTDFSNLGGGGNVLGFNQFSTNFANAPQEILWASSPAFPSPDIRIPLVGTPTASNLSAFMATNTMNDITILTFMANGVDVLTLNVPAGVTGFVTSAASVVLPLNSAVSFKIDPTTASAGGLDISASVEIA